MTDSCGHLPEIARLRTELSRLRADRLIQVFHPWRVGRHEPIHIYAQLGENPSDHDPPIGTMLTPEAAAEAVAGHNALHEGRQV